MTVRRLPIIAVLFPTLLTACGPEARPVTAPLLASRPAAAIAAPARTSADWRDWPLTPGAWRYVGGPAATFARYGDGAGTSFALRCDPAARQVTLIRSGTAAELTITTSSRAARLPAGHVDYEGASMTGVILSANDSLLDAMAFSRGRVMIASPGLPVVIVPAWAEITRAIEDCRK
jgi:hypothetical protein